MWKPEKKRRPVIRAAFLLLLGLVLWAGVELARDPQTPLPSEWNVFEPLRVADPVTPLTGWKLDWAASDPALCLSVLGDAAQMQAMTPLEAGPNCGIASRVALSGVGRARLDRVETRCATALRLAMWEQHGVQPAAREFFGAEVQVIRHIGSYNCRPIRGSQTRWSTHATASAIDISGFDLSDGRRVRLLADWNGDDATSQFLRRVRDAACDWFVTTLSPDYNALHADHFHLQARGWGTCR